MSVGRAAGGPRAHYHRNFLTYFGGAAPRATPGPGRRRSAAAAKGAASTLVGVAPVCPIDGDPNSDYLGDGLADETIATLGQIHPIGLVVIGRTSMMRYKATTMSPADIGRELDADYLLESSIRTEHDRLRVITGLDAARSSPDLVTFIRSRTDRSAGASERAQRRDRRADSFAARASERRWAASAIQLPTRAPTTATSALCSPQRQRTPPSNAASIRLFEEATALDPNFALAWSGLSGIYSRQRHQWRWDPRVIAPRARDAATRAVLADPQLAEAQIAIAWVRFWFDWDWAAAESTSRRALALDPGVRRRCEC